MNEEEFAATLSKARKAEAALDEYERLNGSNVKVLGPKQPAAKVAVTKPPPAPVADEVALGERAADAARRCEHSVLGALMNGEPFSSVREVIGPQDFFFTIHRDYFTAIAALHADGVAADEFTVADRLKAMGKPLGDEDWALLVALRTQTAGRVNVAHHAESLARESRGRGAAAIWRASLTKVATGADIDAVIGEVQSGLQSLARPASGHARIRCIPLAEIVKTRTEWSIKGVIPRRGLGTIYGEYASAKSFLTFDIVAAAARGLDNWRGYRVKERTPVIYIAAEGSGGAGDRLSAYLKHHGLRLEDIALEFVTAPIDLRNPGTQLQELIAAIREAQTRIGKVYIIVVDTLASAMPGGSDSKAEDMSAFVANCYALAEAFDAFVLIVHHAGKDPSKGSRGSTVLPGAVDVEIEVKLDNAGNGTITLNKVRDGRRGDQIGFRLQVVELDELDEDSRPLTSCVVVPETTRSAEPKLHPASFDGATKTAWEALREVVSESGEPMPATSTIPGGVRAVKHKQWRDRFGIRYGADGDTERDVEAVKKAFDRAKGKLLKASIIAISIPYVWLR